MPVVLGGGLSGLAAAFYLGKRHINPVTIYESSKHLGGWIRTENYENENYIFECGPRTIRPKGPAASNTLELIEELGLDNCVRPIFPTHPAARKRMIYAHNKLHPLPSSLGGLFLRKPPFTKPLISGMLHDIATPRSKLKLEDESIYDFVKRRFGSEIAQYAISPMICGICAGDAKEISVRLIMNDIFEKEQMFGGVIKGLIMEKIYKKKKSSNNLITSTESCNLVKKAKDEKWSIYSLEGGLQILPKTIARKLQNDGIHIRTGSECFNINFSKHKAILNVNGEDEYTDYVISSIPSYKLAHLVEHQHPTLAMQLSTIPYVDVAVVNLRFDIPNLLQEEAFGFLVPPAEKLPILGIIFDSCCFDMKGNTVLTVMMGGKWFNEYFGEDHSEEFLLKTALKYVRKILNIDEEPKNSKVSILRNCIPQYTVGHKARVQNIRHYIEKNHLPLSLCGAAYDGIGVNDVILSAKTAIYFLTDKFKEENKI